MPGTGSPYQQYLPLHSSSQGLKRFAVIALPAVILKAMSWPLWLMSVELVAEEPPHGVATTLGHALKHPVTADAGIVTDRQLGAIGKVDAGLLPTKILKQRVER